MTGPTYDLFVSYADADRAWVEGYLLDALEQAGVRCHSEAAFELGAPRLQEFERAVQQSRRILLVLSPAYLADGLNEFIDLLAQSYSLEKADWSVIPLKLHPIALPPRLAMLTALDATDPADRPAIIERLCQALQRPVPGPAPRPPCPYPGMVPFSEQDARHFFGREGEIAELQRRLRHQNYLFVIGPSGSGKSSLVFAGLVPELHRQQPGEWVVKTMRPGQAPLEELAHIFGGVAEFETGYAEHVATLLAQAPGARRLLIVVDQFEELFTQTPKPDQPAFITAMTALRQVPNCVLVPTMRADFYEDLMSSDLWPVDASQRLEIAPLRGAALRDAIAKPAESLGVYLEAGLLERLMADAADEPGVLPLVQETMVLLWERMERRLLPLRAYEDLGSDGRSGLTVAIATKADATLAALAPEQQAIARRIFLRLVQFGEGRADTRRQQTVTSLRAPDNDPVLFEQILRHLTNNRLLTLSGEEGDTNGRVDIAHESLITGWPTLQQWVTERREAEQTRRRLEAIAAEWVRLGRGNGGLLDDVELLEAEQWLSNIHADELGYSSDLHALVDASRATKIKQTKQQRRATRFRIGAVSSIIALVIATLALYVARQAAIIEGARRLAEQQGQAAATAQAFAAEQERLAIAEREARAASDQQARFALSNQQAVQASAVLETHPQRSLLLAAEALNTTSRAGDPPVPAAESAVRQALAYVGGHGLAGHKHFIATLAVSPDNHWLVTSGGWDVDIVYRTLDMDTTARLWNLKTPDTGAHPFILRGHTSSVTKARFSPDGRWLVTIGEPSQGVLAAGVFRPGDPIVRLWDLTAPDPSAHPITSDHKSSLDAFFSSDGRWLITRGGDIVRLWNMTTSTPSSVDLPYGVVGFSPDSRWLAAAGDEFSVQMFDLAAPDPLKTPHILRGHQDTITNIAFSPDSRWMSTSSRDKTARLWTLTSEGPAMSSIVLSGHEQEVLWSTFSPDSRWLFTMSRDSSNTADIVRLWDLAASDPAAKPRVLAGHEGPIYIISFSPDSRWLFTLSNKQFSANPTDTARLWDLHVSDVITAPHILAGNEGKIYSTAFSNDGHWLITAGEDNTPRLWDLTAENPAATPIVLRGHQDQISAAAFSSDSHWLVTASLDKTARLWDLDTTEPSNNPIVLHGHEGEVYEATFSPDSRWLVTGGADGAARLWDLMTPQFVASPQLLRGHEEEKMAFSADGRWLVSSGKTVAKLWHLTTEELDAQPLVLDGYQEISMMVFSPNNRWLIIGDNSENPPKLWDLTTSNPAATPLVLYGSQGARGGIAFSPDSRWLVVSAAGRLWDMAVADPAASARVLFSTKIANFRQVAFSANSRWLAVGSSDGTTYLWDLQNSDRRTDPFILPGPPTPVREIAFSPDNRWLITVPVEGEGIRLWRLEARGPSSVPIILPDRLGPYIFNLAVSADSRWLFTVIEIPSNSGLPMNYSTILWDLNAQNPASTAQHFPTSDKFAFSPDSRLLATGDDQGGVYLWALNNITIPTTEPTPLRGHQRAISAIAFSPDNKQLVTVGEDNTARLWYLTNHSPSGVPVVLDLASIGISNTTYSDIAFSPDSHYLAIRSGDGIRLWILRPDELVDLACRTAGRNLTPVEWEEYMGSEPYRKVCPDLP